MAQLYTGSKDGTVRVWDTSSARCASVVEVGGRVDSLLLEGGFLFVGLHVQGVQPPPGLIKARCAAPRRSCLCLLRWQRVPPAAHLRTLGLQLAQSASWQNEHDSHRASGWPRWCPLCCQRVCMCCLHPSGELLKRAKGNATVEHAECVGGQSG